MKQGPPLSPLPVTRLRARHIFGLCLLFACNKVERDWTRCAGDAAPCALGFVCTPDFRCVLQPDGGARDISPDTGIATAPETASDTAPVAAPDTDSDASVDTAADVAVDTAAPGCKVNGDCQAGRPVCIAGVCAECAAVTDCKDPARAFCVGNACVGCEQAGAGACAGMVCAPASTVGVGGQCVQCLTSATCAAATPICAANVCTVCSTPAQCLAKNPAAPACSASGTCVQCTDNSTCSGSTPVCDTATNKCVACLTSAGCSGATPICANNSCTACTTAGQCLAKNPAAPACATSGTSAGQCVACIDNSTCSGSTPVCDTTANKCVQCLTSAGCSGATPICANEICTACTAASQCATKNNATPACASSGACVQCTGNSTCSGTTPICATSTNTCRGCMADSECAAAPGVCMAHQDGRCASAVETFVVPSGGTLPNVSSLSGKDLVVVQGTASGVLTWTLTSPPQMSIVGQSTGTINGAGGGNAAVHVTGGDLYIRGLTITGGSPGLWADGGAIVRLDHVNVSNNTSGGILLDGAGFDIRNTTISNNAAASGDAGMRIQNAPPSTTIPKSLSLSTVSGNINGVSCASGTASLLTSIPTTVLASGNSGVDITTSCGFTSCGTASTTCGAQP